MMMGWCGICVHKARETWVSTVYYRDEKEYMRKEQNCNRTGLNQFFKDRLYMGDDIIVTLRGGGGAYSTDPWLHLECLTM